MLVSCLTWLAALTLATPVFSENVRVFLVAGQSNSVGLNSDGFTAEDTTDPRILQLSCCGPDGTLPTDQCDLRIASDPLHHDCSEGYLNGQSIGFGMSFARVLLQHIPADETIVLVPAGLSGTGFFDDVWPAYVGWGFQSAVAKLIQTFQRIQEQNAMGSFDGILWHQGEHDAGDNGSGNVANTTYYLNQDIMPMIKAFRDKNLLPFTSETLPFISANLLPSWALDPSHVDVRAGVSSAIALMGQNLLYSASAPSHGLLGDPVYLSGLDNEVIHFTGRSQRILGRRYYAAWLLAKSNVPEKAEKGL